MNTNLFSWEREADLETFQKLSSHSGILFKRKVSSKKKNVDYKVLKRRKQGSVKSLNRIF